jgi:hypothetical protein
MMCPRGRWVVISASAILVLVVLSISPSAPADDRQGGPSLEQPAAKSVTGSANGVVAERSVTDAPAHFGLSGPSPVRPIHDASILYWTNLSSVTGGGAPGPTIQAAMAFDPAANSTVFLQTNPTDPNHFLTWEYRGGSWALLGVGVPAFSPALAYDPADSRLVAFGGSAPIVGSPGSTGPTNATWSFNGSGWTNLTANLTRLPPATSAPLMAYDAADGYLVLLDPSGPSNGSQTWTFGNGNWTNRTSTAGRPPPGPSGADSVLAYDPVAGAIVFFGGSFPGPGYPLPTNQTWEFQAGHWKDLNVSGPPLTIGGVETMIFDPSSQRLVDLVAPSSYYLANVSPSYEDWEFAGGNWTNASGQYSPIPPVGYNPLSVWDATDNYLLYATGGFGGQTWAFGQVTLTARLSVSPAPIDVGSTTTIAVLAVGGAPPLRYSYSQLPPGCQGAAAPQILCSPNGSGLFPIHASVIDSMGTAVNLSGSLEVGPRLTASGPLVSPSATYLGDVVRFSVVVSGGLPPYTFVWSGVPSSCMVPTVAAFNCTATVLGPGAVAVNITDATARGNVSVVTNLTVVAPLQLVSFVSSPGLLELGDMLTLDGTVVGGAPPLRFLFDGLPQGCVGSDASNLTCLPALAGLYNVTLTVTDALGSARNLTAAVQIAPSLTVSAVNVTPNPAPLGSIVSFSYSVAGGVEPFVSHWIGLPPGCVSASGAFECTMNTSGSFNVSLVVRDSLGHSAYSNLSLVVPAASSPPGGPGPFGSTSGWTWAALGAALLGLALLGAWGLKRRRAPPSESWQEEGSATEPTGTS